MKQPKYKGGQCIQLKPYQELKENALSSVYSEDMLQKLGDAQFFIYGILSEERNEVWYQLGQWGHNVLQVPESYIKCEYRADVEQAPVPDITPCKESSSVNAPSIVLVIGSNKPLSSEALLNIAKEVRASEEDVVEFAHSSCFKPIGDTPSFPAQSVSADSISLRDQMCVPELDCSKMNRDERPWHDKFNRKKRKK